MFKKICGVLSMLVECVRMSLQNIFANRLRSFLTVLGILIGVAAVIALITTVNAFSGSLSDSFKTMGAGTLSVTVTGSDLKSGLSTKDLNALTELPAVEGVSPQESLRSRISHAGSHDTRIRVTGRSGSYFAKNEGLVSRGRPINVIDENNSSRVCLINSDVTETLFYGVDPLGETIYIDGMPFSVIGTLADDSAKSVTSIMNGSDEIVIPYTTAMKMNSVNVVTSLTVYLADGVDSDTANDELEEWFDALFSYEEDCYSIMSMSSIEDTMQSMLSMVSSLLAGIASIALVVGGIGIMNMMLTTVTERTAEIGLKKALGALPWQIQVQFLIESFLLSMIGGAAGIALGLGLSMFLCSMMSTDFLISVQAILLGFGFSAAVGIVFGWAPARKASRLNPIDALRSM